MAPSSSSGSARRKTSSASCAWPRISPRSCAG
uniref:Uncharacterized protein n=1 Tax=Arundo donax TaxID=35708 RepID=A0A0A8ZHS4_ARUDO